MVPVIYLTVAQCVKLKTRPHVVSALLRKAAIEHRKVV